MPVLPSLLKLSQEEADYAQEPALYSNAQVEGRTVLPICNICAFFDPNEGEQDNCLIVENTPLEIIPAGQCARWVGISHVKDFNKSFIVTDEDGLRYMVIVTSNAFRDREAEIITERGLKEYAAGEMGTKPEDNVLLFWHNGSPIGDIVYAEYYKSFLLEVALERSDRPINLGEKNGPPVMTTVKTVWDNIESNPGIWGASHGFRPLGKTEDGIIYPFDKKETSVVTFGYQANWYTLSEVLNG